MIRKRRERAFVAVAVLALGAWWLSKRRQGGAHKVGQGFSFGLPGMPPVRFELPARRSYYPTFPNAYTTTYPYYQEPSYRSPAYQQPAYQQPATYRPLAPPSPAPLQARPVSPPKAQPSERVRQAQRALNALFGAILDEDGIFGPKTSEMLASFQQQRGLPVTGSLDAQTIAALATSEATFTQRWEAEPARQQALAAEEAGPSAQSDHWWS